MKLNQKPVPVFNHAGAKASHLNALEMLRRTVLSCMLWEDGFYEDGQTIAERIKTLVPQCLPDDVAELAIEARTKQKLRHVPLLLVRELARNAKRAPLGLIAKTLSEVIQRADEITEFLSIYWKDGKTPISKQVKKGLALAFGKFNEYSLAKYNRDSAIKLRDVLFLVHAKPKDDDQSALWKRLVEGTLETPDTWEVALSGGDDKRSTFERLIAEKKLGYLALLRNLRNMQQSGLDKAIVEQALLDGAANSKALPFRFIAAARAVPQWEPMLDKAMELSTAGLDKLKGSTLVLVDVSGSMDAPMSVKSDLTRIDAACALAILIAGISEDYMVLTFSEMVCEVPARKGMALADAIKNSQSHLSTYLRAAVELINQKVKTPDRLIVITDEQSQDGICKPNGKGYLINVASSQNGVGYGDWTHIHGFSESVISYIQETEKTGM